jgi:quercetin dioxygenase-like cupin family protein
MSQPQINMSCVANLFARMMHFKKAGDIEHGHTHQFDHLTLLASGKLKVTVDGNETIFQAPHMIYIHKDKNHELVALEDNTVAYCIHALRDGNEIDDILDTSMIPKGVSALESGLAQPVVNKFTEF